MTVEMLKGKIHRATVVQAELDYVGSITVDEELLEAAGIMEYEKVQIVDVNNGSRFETYTICGKRGSGMICLNGAAARCVSNGDKIIIMCYAQYEAKEAKEHKPQVVFVDDTNKISRVTNLLSVLLPVHPAGPSLFAYLRQTLLKTHLSPRFCVL
mgnify:FL=1